MRISFLEDDLDIWHDCMMENKIVYCPFGRFGVKEPENAKEIRKLFGYNLKTYHYDEACEIADYLNDLIGKNVIQFQMYDDNYYVLRFNDKVDVCFYTKSDYYDDGKYHFEFGVIGIIPYDATINELKEIAEWLNKIF